jgi:hypothetical protein
MFDRYLTQATELAVPLTDDRYQVNLNDLSVSDNGFVLQTQTNEHGQVCVELDWYAGLGFYPLVKVIAHSFKPTAVPARYWHLLAVEFLDSDPKNLHPSNLVWRYPKGLGCEDNNGFGFIPLYSRYMINRAGAVFDMHRKRFMKSTYSVGYFRFTLISDLGEKVATSRHRVLGFVFLDYPTNVDVMTINHINGVKGDDRLENLEWVTSAQNARHAIETGLRESPKPVIVENVENGVMTILPSLRHCSLLHSLQRPVMVRFMTEAPWVYDKWPYRFSFQNEEDRVKTNVTTTPVLVRDMRTGVVTEYPSIRQGALQLNMSYIAFNARLSIEYDRVCPDGLQIRRKRDVVTWFEPEDVELAIAKSGYLTSCEIRDCLTGEVTTYNSQTETKDALGVCEASMHMWLNFNGKRVFKAQSTKRFIQVRRCSVLGDWYKPEDPQAEYDKVSLEKRVIVRNIQTGEEVVYESAVQCAAAHQILTTTLNYRLSTRGQRKFEYLYQFKYVTDELAFKKIDYAPPPRKRLRKRP